jgi:nickel transport protein
MTKVRMIPKAALCALLWAWIASPAMAHRVNVFAWAENGRVFCEGKFSGGRPAKGAEIVVFDLDGKILLKGKTDEKGGFSFPAPQTGARVVLNASMGHRGEWSISREEMGTGAAPEKNPARRASALRVILGLAVVLALSGAGFYALGRREKKGRKKT